jgi:hypothetical protein
MNTKIKLLAALAGVIVTGIIGTGCDKKPKVDEVSLKDDGGGRKPADFPELAIDVFKAMDSGIALTEDEIKGRNTWNLGAAAMSSSGIAWRARGWGFSICSRRSTRGNATRVLRSWG